MTRSLRSTFVMAVGALVSACSSSSGGLSKGEDGGATTPTKPPVVVGEQDAAAPTNCADSAKLIYLLTTSTGSGSNDLYSFDPRKPGKSAYSRIGTLNCPSVSSAQTMGVDRSGTAWVFYSDGRLFKVDVTTARCTPTSYVYPGAGIAFSMGSGFTALDGDLTKETLFLVRQGLQRFDTAALTRTPVGGPASTAGELTGGPDGKLFVFDPIGNGKLFEVDPVTGATGPAFTFPTGTFVDVTAYAFARFAGSFYLFTSSPKGVGDLSQPSRTTVFDPQSRSTTLRDPDLGFTVVGAGQSVCVPPPIF